MQFPIERFASRSFWTQRAVCGIAAVVLALAPLPAARADVPKTPIGKHIDAIALKDSQGAAHSLSEWKESRAVVVVFLGTECPIAARYAPKLVELAARYKDKKVQFVGIDSNQQDSLVKIAHFVRVNKISYPVLKDPGNEVADQFGALRTPEAFLLDSQRIVRYWGEIDDQFGIGYVRGKPVRRSLEEALDDVLAGKPVRTAVVESVGCRIGRVSHRAPVGDVTYSNQVARVLQKRCVTCHRENEIAPFSLASYRDAKAWAETIREVVETRRMPPWYANPKFGKFTNDARLSDEEMRLICQWIDNGMPEGDAAQLPPKPDLAEGWRIPHPDLVFKMPKPFHVPAKGTVEYQYFTIDPGFKEDVWIRGAEGKPGNRRVVHHMILFYIPPGQEKARPQDALFNAVASFAPGLPASLGDNTYVRRIPAGSRLVFQMHYTPDGAPEVDQSEAGLILADPKRVKKEVAINGTFNFRFLIPPGADNYRIEATQQFTQDTSIHALVPHMHLRGKSFRFTAVYPDGHEEVLLDVPRYFFDWQNIYQLASPKLLPAGSSLHCEATYDNSAKNLSNPNPWQLVRWGDQTWDEMMVGSFYYSLAEQDLSLGGPRVVRVGDRKYEVEFRYRPSHPAKSVSLAGTFNDWKPAARSLNGPDAKGWYTTKLALPEGRYEYKFVVDGNKWRSDPSNSVGGADDRSIRVDPKNPRNLILTGPDHSSVVQVGTPTPPSVVQVANGSYKVAFRFLPTIVAHDVYLAGSFNKWQPKGHKMTGPDRDGWFTTTLELGPGRYEYKFVVDGTTWVSDPANLMHARSYGNSVLWVKK